MLGFIPRLQCRNSLVVAEDVERDHFPLPSCLSVDGLGDRRHGSRRGGDQRDLRPLLYSRLDHRPVDGQDRRPDEGGHVRRRCGELGAGGQNQIRPGQRCRLQLVEEALLVGQGEAPALRGGGVRGQKFVEHMEYFHRYLGQLRAQLLFKVQIHALHGVEHGDSYHRFPPFLSV